MLTNAQLIAELQKQPPNGIPAFKVTEYGGPEDSCGCEVIRTIDAVMRMTVAADKARNEKQREFTFLESSHELSRFAGSGIKIHSQK